MTILIAGAGPVGLSAANALADAGLAVHVLEAEAALPENLRASTFQPPTLDLLDRFGATQKLIAMGRTAPRVQYRDRAGWVAEFDFGLLKDETAHPYRVQCEQFRLNHVLADRLRQFPHARLDFSSPVSDVSQHGDRVRVTVNGKTLDGEWLIGADGGRSRVREAIGVALEGFTWPERFLVASTPFDFTAVMPGLADVSYFADPQEWFFLLRVRDVWRVMFPTKQEEKEEDILSDAGIEARLQRVFRKEAAYPVAHRTLYSVHQRIAASYRSGRVFLAGDAAHLNNPLGGMGMNGGIHDAFALADLLIGKSSDLDAYERARRPVALDYVNNISSANKRNLETNDPAWREQMSRTAADPRLARDYLMRISMIASLRKAQCA
jgi:3-(3-hydroxy-phenyl)propionate hydroxylase